MNEKLKILYVLISPRLGGGNYSLLQLLEKLDRENYETYALVPKGPIIDKIESLGCKIIESRWPLQWIPFTHDYHKFYFIKFLLKIPFGILEVVKIIKKYKIDIVHTNDLVCLNGAVGAKITHKPHVWHIREIVKDNNHYILPFNLKIINTVTNYFSNKVIANSHYTRRSFIKNIKNNKVITIYNGVNIAKFEQGSASRDKLQKEFNIKKDVRLIGVIGGVAPRKGILDIIETAAILERQNSNFNYRFVIVGPSTKKFMRLIKERIANLDLESRFIFTGQRDDVNEIIHSFDLLISAARLEPFGRTLIEAMAASKPVVAINNAGPKEIVVNGFTGYLIPPQDIKALANAIMSILSNPKIGQKFGQDGKKRAKILFSAEQYVRNVENIYQKIKL